MTEEDLNDVIEGMLMYGGNFEAALAGLTAAADAVNRAKIKRTWPELWEKYLEYGRKLREMKVPSVADIS